MSTLNTEKARQTILYICHKTANNGSFGNVLLNKALYYADHISYLKTGETITGFSYVKQAQGPTPAPYQYCPLRDQMLADCSIKEHQTERFGYIHKHMAAKIAPDMNVFSAAEISLIDEVIEELSCFSASEVSGRSHDLLAWQIADMMEDLPPFAYLLTQSDLTQDDLTWGEAVFEANKAA